MKPILHKNSKIVSTKIRSKRLVMGYSVAEMAECLGLKKSTYQKYENGTRQAGNNILKTMEKYHLIDRKFMAGLPKRIDQALKGKMILSEPAWVEE
jgi:transcriptional regulator with XRE-family HTH domain